MASRVYPRPATVPELILASTSKFRQALLAGARLPFRAVSPDVDESAPAGTPPRTLARRLALEKAQAVAARFPEALVIGSDQTPDVGGRLLRKPTTRAEAKRQLTALSGRDHFLHTAVALVRLEPRVRLVQVESVRITFRKLTSREIERYLDTEEWQGCAGGYRVEGAGIQLMRAMRGDYHAIVGLPMLRLVGMLESVGYPLL